MAKTNSHYTTSLQNIFLLGNAMTYVKYPHTLMDSHHS